MSALQGRRMAGNVGLNLLGHGLPLLAALPAVPLLIAGAGIERFGLLTIAWALMGYVGLFDFGVGRALTHAVADRMGRGRAREVRGVVRVGVRVALALSAAGGAALFLAAPALVGFLNLGPGLSDEAVLAVRVLGPAVPFVVLAAVLRGVLEGLHRFGVVNAVRVPMGVATFVAPLAALPFSEHLAGLVGGLVAARILGWAGYGWGVRRALASEEFSAEEFSAHGEGPSAAEGRLSAEAGPLLRYGGWATVTNLVGPLMVYFDRIVIGVVLTASAVAYYTTPFEIAHRLLIIPGAVVGVFFPAFSELWAREQTPDRRARHFESAVMGILVLTVPPAAALFAFAPEGLALWVGDEFARAGTVPARWLLVGMVVNAAAHVPFVFVQGVGRPDLTARIHLVEVPLYAGALFWVLPRWGITGAAVVWAVRASVDLVLMATASGYLARELRRPLLRCLGVVAGCGVLVASPALVEGMMGRAAGVGALWMAAAGIVLWWASRGLMARP